MKGKLMDIILRWLLASLVLCIEHGKRKTSSLIHKKNICTDFKPERSIKKRRMLGTDNHSWWPILTQPFRNEFLEEPGHI